MLLLLSWTLSSTAIARPGGGSSFRSSSSSRSSSGSSRSSSSYSSSRSSYSSSRSTYDGGGTPLSPEAEALLLDFGVGLVLGVPGLIALSLLMAGFRKTGQARKSGRPSVFRMMNGVFVLAIFGFFLANKLATAPAVTPLMMILLFILGFIYQLNQLTAGQTIVASAPVARRSLGDVATHLAGLRRRDEGFSRVVFLDFVQALYDAVYTGHGTPAARNLGVYVADDVLGGLDRELAGARVSAVVIGAMSIDEVRVGAEKETIVVDLEANYTKERSGDSPERFVARERWAFTRPRGTISPPPERLRALGCPSCGATLSVSELGACTYCAAPIRSERLCWRVSRRVVVNLEVFSTEGLGETVPEEGTDRETIYDHGLADAAQALAADDGAPSTDAFLATLSERTVAPTFKQMYAAWSAQRWGAVRHLLTDFLWEAQQHWIRAYAEKKLTNKLDDLALGDVQLVRVERDKYYDAVTVRLFASCRDYTVDGSGKVIGGDAKRTRRFSEYWTFVRSRGHKAVHDSIDARASKCPACGAPVDRMGSTGICGYCNAKVTTGDFGWVLATITQDEVYA